MALEGLHHVTAITADAPRNVAFHVGTLGLRLVKRTVNFDQPDVYHLYYGDERGTPGSLLTFFEFPGAALGRPGAGMVHRLLWRVGSAASLPFWEARLAAAGRSATPGEDGRSLAFEDPEGLAHEIVAVEVGDAPLRASAPDIPAEHALAGLHGVRAYGEREDATAPVLEALGLDHHAGTGAWVAAGDERHGLIAFDPPPAARGVQGAGTVHHVAWSAADDGELAALRAAASAAGARPTPIIDRRYFHSVYFREPGGVLFELASRDIGFAVDEDPAALGTALQLPARYEDRRAELERRLTPLPDPRQEAAP